jgi:hypothetical protein
VGLIPSHRPYIKIRKELIKMFGIGILIAIVSIIVLIAGIISLSHPLHKDDGKISIIFGLFILVVSIIMIIVGFSSNSTQRRLKDIRSDYSDGIHRTIIITAEDGREIYSYTGTVDLEIDADTRKIKFEDENNKRQIIIYGVQDTVTIIEN